MFLRPRIRTINRERKVGRVCPSAPFWIEFGGGALGQTRPTLPFSEWGASLSMPVRLCEARRFRPAGIVTVSELLRAEDVIDFPQVQNTGTG